MTRDARIVDGLARPGGTYSDVVRNGSMVFLAGMIGIDKEGRLVGTDIGAQTKQALRNMATALAAVGGELADVCSVTAFLEHGDDFAGYDAAYAGSFPTAPPVRATVQAHIFMEEAPVEIQAVAIVEVPAKPAHEA
jgi:2-iminobutanoate/2-iminopropanoate deaminase